jgi:hypothetical protein
MNKVFILDKNYLSYLLRQIRKKMSLIAPLRAGNEDVILKTVENIHEIELNCPASIPSVKEFLFPQKEDMFRFSEGTADILKNNTRRVIFGVRSCDISAILSLIDSSVRNLLMTIIWQEGKTPYLFLSSAIIRNQPVSASGSVQGLFSNPILISS